MYGGRGGPGPCLPPLPSAPAEASLPLADQHT